MIASHKLCCWYQVFLGVATVRDIGSWSPNGGGGRGEQGGRSSLQYSLTPFCFQMSYASCLPCPTLLGSQRVPHFLGHVLKAAQIALVFSGH